MDILTPEHKRWSEFKEKLWDEYQKYGCRHDHSLTRKILRQMGGFDIENTIEYFCSEGGYCDCEVGLNVGYD